ncbi:MAG: FtsX-like permease family protein [bacterium]
MKVLKLVFRNAMRHRLRSALTMLGVALAVMAFGLIRTFIAAWFSQAEIAAPDRLITRHAVSLIFPLPVSYKEQLEKIDGVEMVTYANWFGGIYIDPANFFPQFAADHETFFKVYPEYITPPEEMEAFRQDRQGVIVGRSLADRFGWQVGDKITLIGTIFPGNWDFNLRGIYTGREEATDETNFIFRWDYLDETMKQQSPGRAGQVGWYGLKITDPNRSAEISALVDERFANSWAETLTETEKAFTLSFFQGTNTIIVGLKVISVLIIGIILLVLTNTMAMTARERTREYAYMKTLGFRPYHLLGMIVGESLVIAMMGGVIGILLMVGVANVAGVALSNFLPTFAVPESAFYLALIISFVVGLAAAIAPTARAVRLPIVDGLRIVD